MRDVFLVLFKHKMLIAGVFLVAIAVALLACALLDPVYEASSKLMAHTPPGVTTAEGDSGVSSSVDVAVEMLSGRFLIEQVIKEIDVEKIYPDIKRPSLFSKLTPLERAVLRFRENLSVRRGPIITVLFQHSDPVIAADVVNRLVERFLDQYLSARRQHQKYEFFKEQLALMEKKLQDSQRELGLFRNENNISSIQKQKSLLLLQISDMEVELAKTRAEIGQQEDLAETSAKNPRELSEIQAKLAALRSKEKKLVQQITQYRLSLGQLDKAETRLNELERQVKIDEENYLLYAKKTEEARIASAMDEQKLANFCVIEPSLPPIRPVRPNKILLLFAAVLIGAGAGIVLALLREYLTHTFDTAEDVTAVLGSAAPAALPELSPAELGRAAQFHYPDDTIEQCMRVYHHLVRSLPDRISRSIIFTGAADRVGTSSALLAMGCALVRHGNKVLLIDANLRAPVLHRLCSCDDAAGLSDVLTNGLSLQDVVKKTPLDNLMLVPAGTLTENPALLLRQDRCRDLFCNARDLAEWILVDTPAVNMFNDAALLEGIVDGAVLVIRAGVTRWQVARSAAARLQQYNLKLLCALLTRHKKHIPDWIYRRL